jgi:uncharacterized FAD-dependent dehydrogenase
MRARTVELSFTLDEPMTEADIALRAARALAVPVDALGPVVVERRSVDARRGKVSIHLRVSVGGDEPGPLALPHPIEVKRPARIVIVGMGPAGLFCAYALARRGIASIVLERGKQVQPRRHDLKLVNQRGVVDPESNYCFGEGGAGTYSDGKLYTRATKRGPVRDVIEILALHGAPAAILVDARPHIGSNLLPKVVTSVRERLESVGVEFRFGAKVTDLIVDDHAVRGVRVEGAPDIEADHVVVATGHSARDVFHLLDRAGAALEAKAFALGVRIEHPQALIDEIQYGACAGHPALSAAAYSLVHTEDGVGVFSFCMCPGGFIVPAMTAADEVVVNGMSPSKRNSRFANSGVVVGVSPDDASRAGFSGWARGLSLQSRIEHAAFAAGGGAFRAPATRATDFVASRASRDVPVTSYQPGLVATDVSPVLDVVDIGLSQRLRTALRVFDRKMRGYVSNEAVLVGVESRTSSPVRVIRDPETLESPTLRGLYPTGEGAGFAGGIVSAALDGLSVAERILRRVTPL